MGRYDYTQYLPSLKTKHRMKKLLIGTVIFAFACNISVFAKKDPAVIKLNDIRLMDEVRTQPYPKNGATADKNPTPLMWPDKFPHLGPVLDGVEEKEHKQHVTYKVRLSQDPKFKKDVFEETRNWAFFNPFQKLKEGKWYWQYAYVDKNNNEEWSETFHFFITKESLDFNPPSLSQLKEMIPQHHPRVWMDKKDWNHIIEKNKNNDEVKQYIRQADKALKTKLGHIGLEIDTSKLHSLDNEIKRKSYLIRESRKIVDREERNVESLVRAYLLTKEQRYYEGAIARIEEMLSWKGHRYFAGDFNSSVLLSLSAMSYDAFYDLLTPEDKTILLNGIKDNGDLFFEEFVNHLENRIADNHVWQMTFRILTTAAFASWGDLPEASTWLDYCYNMWIARFPGLNNDGGWHNGDSYFHVNIKTLIEVPFLLSRITGFDFFADPWYNNNVKYVIYQQPPFSKSAGHGTSHENYLAPSATRIGYADALSRELQNPYAGDYVKMALDKDPKAMYKGFLGKSGDLTWYRAITPNKLNIDPKRTLATMPVTKVFPETGLATMNTNLDKPEENAMFSFRSSPYGSTSHALADQNGFHTFYGGEAIFYSTGHRTGFTDEHMMYHYRNARSHNTILADSMTQTIGTEGYGWIPRHFTGKNIAYFVGDASNAYGQISAPLWIERAELSDIEFSEKNGWGENRVNTFRRHVVQLGNDGLVLIYDELEGKKPVAWTYQLHTRENDMKVTGADNHFTVTGYNSKGVSDAHIFTSAKSGYTQHNEFASPAVNWLNKTGKDGKPLVYENHHSVGITTSKTKHARIISIIDTRAKNAKPVSIERISDSQIKAGDWIINANLTSEGDAYFNVVNNSLKSGVNFNSSLIELNGKKIKLKEKGATMIIENGKSHIVTDEVPELEI